MTHRSHDQDYSGPAGMGIAARFTLGLAIVAVLFTVIAGYGLIRGVGAFNTESVEAARKEMAATTARVQAEDPVILLPPESKSYQASPGQVLRIADVEWTRAGENEALRLYQVDATAVSSDEGAFSTQLFVSQDSRSRASDQLLVLILMAGGALVLVNVWVGGYTAKRLVEPLRSMIEDILAISRGHYRTVRAPGAVGEVALLSRAVNRMVDGLVEGQETQTQLEEKERESDVLREFRSNLQPMTVVPPQGYGIETLLVQAEATGSSDFVDALADEDNRPTLIVGAGAASGMPGSLLMAMTRAYLRGAVLSGLGPAEACDSANASLNRDLARGLYSAAMVARVEPSTGEAELVSAGHQVPAVRWDAASGELRKLQPNGIALGFDGGPVFRKSLELLQLRLEPGDALFMCSTSVVEAASQNGKTLGEAGIYQLAKLGIESGFGAMEEKLRSFLGSAPESDLAFALVRRETTSASSSE